MKSSLSSGPAASRPAVSGPQSSAPGRPACVQSSAPGRPAGVQRHFAFHPCSDCWALCILDFVRSWRGGLKGEVGAFDSLFKLSTNLFNQTLFSTASPIAKYANKPQAKTTPLTLARKISPSLFTKWLLVPAGGGREETCIHMDVCV